jgi:hypothetical protein
MENGLEDLLGIYGTANTRIALLYGLKDNITLGLGTEAKSRLQDLNWKVALLKQTRSGSVPVSVSYYGNVVWDARDKSNFQPEIEYRHIHRLSYLTQIIVARKFNDILSLQMAPKFVYYNAIKDSSYKNVNYGISVGGRARIWESKSIIFEYDQPLTPETNSKPNIALGLEIGTATHAFQVFATNYRGILGQNNLVYNTNDPFSGEIAESFMFGFNITVKF